jgi:hypothetical protein
MSKKRGAFIFVVPDLIGDIVRIKIRHQPLTPKTEMLWNSAIGRHQTPLARRCQN